MKLKRLLPLPVLLGFFSFTSFSQNSPIGIFDSQQDIGYVKHAGSSTYDAATQSYIIKGSGANIWFNEDQFHYTYKKISGDFILTADFDFYGDTVGAIGHRKVGWMVRESVAADAVSMNGCKHIDGLIALQWRPMKGAFMQDPQGEIFSAKRGLQTMQLERRGKTLIMRMANPGEPLQEVGEHELIDLKDTVLAGIYVCSHDSNTLAAGRVWNVRIDHPVENPYQPNPLLAKPAPQTVMGCRLEIVDMVNGNRKVIYESRGRFEAPNWMPDGKKLLYNDHGSLYTIPIEGGTPEKLNTGSAARLNNDHGISYSEPWSLYNNFFPS
ncbi:MAG TPA: hypothetical protein VK622_00995, partial [Puia sp.]|nr:hypothetical protein [Puia sp.]